jgi:hypothetical protein
MKLVLDMWYITITAPNLLASCPTAPGRYKVGAKHSVHTPFDLSTLLAVPYPVPELSLNT